MGGIEVQCQTTPLPFSSVPRFHLSGIRPGPRLACSQLTEAIKQVPIRSSALFVLLDDHFQRPSLDHLTLRHPLPYHHLRPVEDFTVDVVTAREKDQNASE